MGTNGSAEYDALAVDYSVICCDCTTAMRLAEFLADGIVSHRLNFLVGLLGTLRRLYA